MKTKLTTAVTLLAASLGLVVAVLAQQAPAAKPANASPSAATSSNSSELKTQKDKASYAIGMSIGMSLKRDGLEIDPAIVLRGMQDMLSGGKLLLTDEEARSMITEVEKEARANQEAKIKAIGEQNKKEGEAFLAANKSKPGVIILPSGLEYKVEKQGDGPKPLATDTVECNYRGTLIDGKEFDSSYKHGKPAVFPVSGVIKGWTEVLQLMPVGSKYKVFIPAELAYGSRGAGGDIGPNATLIFEIDLLSIEPRPAAAKPAAPASPAATKPAEPAK